jgi:hypothetical protein
MLGGSLRKLFHFLAFLLLLPCFASAGYIQLTTSSNPVLVDNYSGAHLDFSIRNTGNEAAYSLRFSLLLPEGVTAAEGGVSKLDANGSYSSSFELIFSKNLAPGTYGAALLVDYADANGYRFSSVSPAVFSVQREASSLVQSKFFEVSLQGSEPKTLELVLRNLDDAPHGVALKLFFPRELKANSYEQKISVEPKSEKQISFEVSSVGALPDSSYSALLLVEYEQNGVHYSSLSSGVISVGTAPVLSPFLLLAVVLLAATAVAVYLFARRSGSPKP